MVAQCSTFRTTALPLVRWFGAGVAVPTVPNASAFFSVHAREARKAVAAALSTFVDWRAASTQLLVL